MSTHNHSRITDWVRSDRQRRTVLPFAISCRQVAVLFLWVISATTEQVSAQERSFLGSTEARALTLLHERCFSCHNEEDRKGGLVLTSKAAIESANQEFDLLRPGQPNLSELIAVLAADADPHMPPKEQLTDAEIKLLSDWVSAGGKWAAPPASTGTPTPVLPSRDQLSPAAPSVMPVLAMALSPSEEQLAFGRGNRLFVCQSPLEKGAQLTRLTGHRDYVRSLAWNPLIENRLASGGYRRIVYWDTAAEEPLIIQEAGIEGQVTALSFSSDGRLLYAGVSRPGISGVIHCWTIPEFEDQVTWKGHEDSIFALDVSSDGSFLASASGDRSIAFWETDTFAQRSRIEAHSTQIMAISFSADCRRLVTAGTDHQLRVWEWAKGDPLFQLGRHKQGLFATQWSGDGMAIVAADESGTVFRYTQIEEHSGAANARAAKEKKLKKVLGPVQSIATDHTGGIVYVGTQAGSVHILNEKGNTLNELTPPKEDL